MKGYFVMQLNFQYVFVSFFLFIFLICYLHFTFFYLVTTSSIMAF